MFFICRDFRSIYRMRVTHLSSESVALVPAQLMVCQVGKLEIYISTLLSARSRCLFLGFSMVSSFWGSAAGWLGLYTEGEESVSEKAKAFCFFFLLLHLEPAPGGSLWSRTALCLVELPKRYSI